MVKYLGNPLDYIADIIEGLYIVVTWSWRKVTKTFEKLWRAPHMGCMHCWCNPSFPRFSRYCFYPEIFQDIVEGQRKAPQEISTDRNVQTASSFDKKANFPTKDPKSKSLWTKIGYFVHFCVLNQGNDQKLYLNC